MCNTKRVIILIGLIIVATHIFNSSALSQESAPDIFEGSGKKWVGDYGLLVEKRVIRALVPFSKTYFFLDGATPRGATYELIKQFEKEINIQLKTRHLKVLVIVIPTPRDRLIPDLVQGRGDIAAGNLTITDSRLKQVDFSDPLLRNVSEIIVSGKGVGPLKNKSDLSGKTIYVRKSSSYFESLETLNQQLAAEGKPPVELVEVSDYLEDEDLLEMVNVGLIPMIIIDDHKGRFWAKIFKNIRLHSVIKVREGGKIAWAFRKNSPELAAVINNFVKKNKKGTLLGNILFKRYLQNTNYIRNNLTSDDMKRFRATVGLFKKYAHIYSFDWLMLAALAYQESTIDQSKRSPAGAIGVMQILPSTAAGHNVNIPDIENIDSNIHAGTKYLRFMLNHYFDGPALDPFNRTLLAFASYNAGPNKISRLRKQAAREGFDPNIWFDNVEVIAAKKIGRETVQYVSNILKYYIAYKIIAEKAEIKKSEKENNEAWAQ